MKIMMTWGFFSFTIKSLPYQGFDRSSNYRYGKNERVGARAAYQYLGQGDETITITGKLLPLITGGRNAIDLLRLQASLGMPWPLVERTGKIHGFYFCKNVNDVSRIFENTGAPNIVDFTLEFERAGDDRLDLGGIIASQLAGMI